MTGCSQEFLALLPEAVERFEIVVHGYALMPNHFHLLLESTHGNLSRAMAYVSATFSRRLNNRFHWDGSIFRGHFHNPGCDSARSVEEVANQIQDDLDALGWW